MKLHLKAVAESEGARLLARHIVDNLVDGLHVELLADAWGVTATTLQRIVDGEITPGVELGTCLFSAAGIQARDFKRKPIGWWFDSSVQLHLVAA